MRIIAIETSCDETAAAVLEFNHTNANTANRRTNTANSCVVLSNVVHSQIVIHRKTGGVVPEVAAREHVQKIIPVVEAALRPLMEHGTWSIEHSPRRRRGSMIHAPCSIDCIAVTYGPGLITSLMVGVETARTLAWAWKVPLVAVNHMEGHISAALLQELGIRKLAGRDNRLQATSYKLQAISYPALALVVSGGHTELVLMKKPLQYQIIGATRDDAAGEAFDKVAKILGLPYPGGPEVSKLAESGDPTAFPFSRPMLGSNDYDFSFSGIKTAVLYTVRDLTVSSRAPTQGRGVAIQKRRGEFLDCFPPSPRLRRTGAAARNDDTIVRDLCASFQKAVIDVLVAKTIRAAKEFKAKTIILAGGVAANKQLRQQLASSIQRELPTSHFQLPTSNFCTDNAVMIALAAYPRALKKQFTPWQKLDVDPNLVLGDN